MAKYDVLVRVLDRLLKEAPEAFRSYHPEDTDLDAVNAARAKAYLHLFLKVRFGLLTFEEREAFVTEGSQDGGIDAFYIDPQRKVIFFVQSKFRQNERNFEAKPIELEELLRMDIDRILSGETRDSQGVEYNSKIKALVRKIQSIGDISRYRYQVVVMANVKDVARPKLQYLTGGFPAEVFDYARCYRELIFPLVTATYYSSEDLHLPLNLSNKNAAAKISYTVVTEAAKLEITVVFVPTIEIAKAMHRYRNAILRYNPRSYLEHEGQSVNAEIRRSIEERKTNEFALFNNGITLLSDGTFLNERIGQKDRAQLTIVNPQIINGGQTAYTLSQIYREHDDPERAQIFGDKEVLVKIITFDSEERLEEGSKLELIDAISRATNSQTVVSKADRRSNDQGLKSLQDRCFEACGIWLERKRGEFLDGVREGYIDEQAITERNLFFRAMAIARGQLVTASAKRIFVKSDFKEYTDFSDEELRKAHLALKILRLLHEGPGHMKNRVGVSVVMQSFLVMNLLLAGGKQPEASSSEITKAVDSVKGRVRSFFGFLESKYKEDRFWLTTKGGHRRFNVNAYIRQPNITSDALEFFSPPPIPSTGEPGQLPQVGAPAEDGKHA
jgi:hypothetical protein